MLNVENAFPSRIVQKSHMLWWLTVRTDSKWLFLASTFCKVLSVWLNWLSGNIRKSGLDSKSPCILKILYVTSNVFSPHSHHSNSHRYLSGALGSSLASHWGLGGAWRYTKEWVRSISLATVTGSGVNMWLNPDWYLGNSGTNMVYSHQLWIRGMWLQW